MPRGGLIEDFVADNPGFGKSFGSQGGAEAEPILFRDQHKGTVATQLEVLVHLLEPCGELPCLSQIQVGVERKVSEILFPSRCGEEQNDNQEGTGATADGYFAVAVESFPHFPESLQEGPKGVIYL